VIDSNIDEGSEYRGGLGTEIRGLEDGGGSWVGSVGLST